TVVDPKAGVVYMQPSAANPTTVELFVTGADDAAVLMAAKSLATSSAFSRFKGQQGVVMSVPEPGEAPEGFRQKMTFAELGYEDQTASGTRRQTLNYVIPLPMQWQVLTEAKLDLHFAHSRLLHQQRSSLTVGINGSPIGSILLDGTNADDGHSTFTIPARMLKIGDNKLTITTDIELIDGYEDPQACDDEHITEAWVVAYSDSNFTLPGGPASMTLNLCIGRLKSLEFALAVQTQSAQELWKEYADILKHYPEELR
ncbi:MAG TPA: cellulose biosynthesis cyclic di-GMP-binding regulatory protein BcsB, partial [Anaerolineaceae bacterium]|nr:cellulose biosynthesis cyclic di-GMP-binding regulatory protein BcsB [Anaerolineaceae bacterium]